MPVDVKKQGIPFQMPDIQNVESFSDKDYVQWIEISERLLLRVRELEELMLEVRTDLKTYRRVREEWRKCHEEWKQSREAI